MTDLIETVENGVLWLTLNRPDRLNALSQPMLGALYETLSRAADDPAIGVVVVTGAGRGFCAGGDVKAMAERGDPSFEERAAGLRRMHRLPLLMRTMPKVVIAMVNGPSVGAGLGLAMACDLRFAGRAARFATGFAGVGYSGDFGGSWSLTRLVGTAKARELYLLGETVDAEGALALGLVNRVVEDAELRGETMRVARHIADGPRIAYGYMKRNLFAAETEPFAAVLEMEAVHQARTGMTEDHREAARAFVEKRKPVFRGR
jgi:2-(1,2-epoxy-1,2-dihydrophenyl)acetyl-CoA isomerase